MRARLARRQVWCLHAPPAAHNIPLSNPFRSFNCTSKESCEAMSLGQLDPVGALKAALA